MNVNEGDIFVDGSGKQWRFVTRVSHYGQMPRNNKYLFFHNESGEYIIVNNNLVRHFGRKLEVQI
jgi:hypothetical protein